MGEIGTRLRAARDASGLNQSDFGGRGGVSRNTQLNYETGARSPDANYLLALHDAGLIDLQFVLTGQQGLGDSLTQQESELLLAARQLTNVQQGNLLVFLKSMLGSGA